MKVGPFPSVAGDVTSLGEGGLLKAPDLERDTASGGGAPSGRGGLAGEAEGLAAVPFLEEGRQVLEERPEERFLSMRRLEGAAPEP